MEDPILMHYLRVSQHLSQQFRNYFGRLNLTFPQALVLNILAKEGPMPISQLAERTGSANSTVSGILTRLERLRLVTRIRSNTDRRVIYVKTTVRYKKLRKKAETGVNEYFDSLLKDLSADERETIVKGLKLLDQSLMQAQEPVK